MDRKSGNSLPDLPRSSDKFWNNAQKYRTEFMKNPKHTHYFDLKEREIQCQCGLAYPFTGKEYVVDGRIGYRT